MNWGRRPDSIVGPGLDACGDRICPGCVTYVPERVLPMSSVCPAASDARSTTLNLAVTAFDCRVLSIDAMLDLPGRLTCPPNGAKSR